MEVEVPINPPFPNYIMWFQNAVFSLSFISTALVIYDILDIKPTKVQEYYWIPGTI